MTSSPPDDDLQSVERLLRERVETYDQLELLLWISSGNGEPRSTRETSEALSLTEPAVTDAFKSLAKAGLVRQVVGSGRFRYEPQTPELAAAVRMLALLNEQDRIRVIRMMNAHAIARLRSSVLQTFGPRFLRRGGK